MKNLYYIRTAAFVALLMATHIQAQHKILRFQTDETKHAAIVTESDTVKGSYSVSLAQLTVMTRNGYTAIPEFAAGQPAFFSVCKQTDDYLQLKFDYNYEDENRVAKLRLTSPDGFTKVVEVNQKANQSAANLKTENKLKIVSGEANQAQSGQGIDKSFDGDLTTLYHSPYDNTKMPVVLTYRLAEASHVDYMVYNPRRSGGTNGLFGEVLVEYATSTNPDVFVTVADTDFKMSSSSSFLYFGETGADDVQTVRVTVKSGQGGMASCAEMEFYQTEPELAGEIGLYFEDALCTRLKDGVSEETVAKISNEYVKRLVHVMLQGNYETKYRVAEYEPYRTLSSLASSLKTNKYNPYENPTGLYFTQGKSVIAFVEGIGNSPVQLKIKNFNQAYEGESQDESTYVLHNGVNVITPKNRGNGYVDYYTDDYATAPNIKVHFAMADVTGYFDLERGDTNEDWQNLLANSCSDIIDLRTPRIQVAFPKARFKEYCPKEGKDYALILDSIVYREREVMGLVHYDKEPKNRQFARVVWSGYMFADNTGAGAQDNSVYKWINPSREKFNYWGLAHELGHVNQLRPSFKWVGLGETTNNLYSAWVLFTMGPTGQTGLVTDKTGFDDFKGLKGGRFNAYLESSVRKRERWMLQKGPDNYNKVPVEMKVADQDYAGNKLGKDTIVYMRDCDHMGNLVPLWQLQLYCHQCKISPHVYAKVMEGLRKASDANMSNGMQQMRFMRTVCDSTQINFLPFFEKAGMLQEYNDYLNDYTKNWMKINQQMIDELKAYVEEKGYPTPKAEVNYINDLNWKTYAEKLPLQGGSLNSGCSLSSGRIKVQHSVWKNVVAFETYDAKGNLLRISMQGLGGDANSNNFTQVLWPQNATEKAAYIMAVGWDGTRIKCYEP